MSVVEVGEGYDFKVLLVDDEWVFRFARRQGVVAALETEVALLPALAAALPVAVPRFEDGLRARAGFYHRLAPWFEAHYGLFTNKPTHVERGLAGIRSRL